MSEEVSKLDLVTTEELLEELSKRFDAVLFAAEQSKTDTSTDSVVWWSGALTYCYGLANRAVLRLGDKIQENSGEDEDD